MNAAVPADSVMAEAEVLTAPAEGETPTEVETQETQEVETQKLLRDPHEVPDKVINPSVAESSLAQFQSWLLKPSFKMRIVSALRMPCAIGCHSFPASLESTVRLKSGAERLTC